MFNRVAFVTGASRGIGRAIALSLCRSGFDIVVASPEIEKNEEVAEEIRACSGEAMTVNLDVTSPESVKEAFAKALADKTPHRRAGEQRRHHPRRSGRAHEAGRLGPGAEDQPDRRIPLHAGRCCPG